MDTDPKHTAPYITTRISKAMWLTWVHCSVLTVICVFISATRWSIVKAEAGDVVIPYNTCFLVVEGADSKLTHIYVPAVFLRNTRRVWQAVESTGKPIAAKYIQWNDLYKVWSIGPLSGDDAVIDNQLAFIQRGHDMNCVDTGSPVLSAPNGIAEATSLGFIYRLVNPVFTSCYPTKGKPKNPFAKHLMGTALSMRDCSMNVIQTFPHAYALSYDKNKQECNAVLGGYENWQITDNDLSCTFRCLPLVGRPIGAADGVRLIGTADSLDICAAMTVAHNVYANGAALTSDKKCYAAMGMTSVIGTENWSACFVIPAHTELSTDSKSFVLVPYQPDTVGQTETGQESTTLAETTEGVSPTETGEKKESDSHKYTADFYVIIGLIILGSFLAGAFIIAICMLIVRYCRDDHTRDKSLSAHYTTSTVRTPSESCTVVSRSPTLLEYNIDSNYYQHPCPYAYPYRY